MQAHFLLIAETTDDRPVRMDDLMLAFSGDHPRELTHGTVLDDIVHAYMCETKDFIAAAELNQLRYVSLN